MVISMGDTLIDIGEPSSIKGVLVNNVAEISELFIIRRNDSVESYKVKQPGEKYSSTFYYTGNELDDFLQSNERKALVFLVRKKMSLNLAIL